jgi:hypothetical protein
LYDATNIYLNYSPKRKKEKIRQWLKRDAKWQGLARRTKKNFFFEIEEIKKQRRKRCIRRSLGI